MGVEELHILCEEQTKDLIDRNIERKHTDVALDKALCHSALVASQVKYLQRARTKLPSYYAARCIIPSLSFEQSSSEATAAAKDIGGTTLLELTCGLGVDTLHLSQRFDHVVTLERDPQLAAVAKENFQRLGVTNVEVVCCSAEEYLENCTQKFDWIYVDPDRRGTKGEKRVLLEDCSPNVLEVWSDMERISDRVAVKCSPMFDVDEAFRLFPNCSVEVVSLGDECKEVMIYIGAQEGVITATAVGRGAVWMEREDTMITIPQHFDTERYTHLIIPDVALQKSRLARRVLSEVGDIWSDNGYCFCGGEGVAKIKKNRHLARVETIDWIGEYEPKVIRQELKARGIKRAEILKREFPHSVDRITKQLHIGEGGAARIAFTKIGNRLITIILKR